MAMSNSWQKAYEELVNFVAGNPRVKIEMNVIAIPGDLRPEFYRLFDSVRVTFLEEKFPALLNEAKTLSHSYITVEEDVIKLLGLTDILLPATLNWFLHDPINGLKRGMFYPLFDLLKGKIDAGAFEQVPSRNIEGSFRDLYRSGYEKWVTLSLVKLLASDKVFNVTAPEIDLDVVVRGEDSEPSIEESVPEAEESKHLSFAHEAEAAFIVPDFIVHSAKVNRYVAIGTELGKAIFAANNASYKREWYSLSSIGKEYGPVFKWPDLVIYIADEPEDINLVADAKRICRPDLIIECMEQKGWPEKEGLEKVRLHHDILKPRLGTYIVSREPVPEEVYKELVLRQVSEEAPQEPVPQQEQPPASEQEALPVDEPEKRGEDIHILTVGFDPSQLAPIISILMN